MTEREVAEATTRRYRAIQFRQKGNGYWHYDTLTDRNAGKLTGVNFRPRLTEDEVLTDFSGVAFCQFNTPPLSRAQEARDLTAAYQRRKEALAAIAAQRPLDDAEQRTSTLVDYWLAELIDYPSAEVLDSATENLPLPI